MAPQLARAAWSIMVRDARRAALLTMRISSRGDGRESVLDDRPHYAAVQVVSAKLDCFAALAMTVSGFPASPKLTRTPIAFQTNGPAPPPAASTLAPAGRTA